MLSGLMYDLRIVHSVCMADNCLLLGVCGVHAIIVLMACSAWIILSTGNRVGFVCYADEI